MAAITWSNEYSVGVHALDTDHKLLISLINQLDESIAEGAGQETIGSVFNALLDYTEYHFGREEKLMEASGFPDTDDHIKSHDAIREKVQEIRVKYAKGNKSDASQEVLDFMKSWLTDHILGTDKKYKPFMEGKTEEMEHTNRAFINSLQNGTNK